MGKELIQDIKQPKRRLAEILPRNRVINDEVIEPPRPRRRRGWLWFFLLLIIFGLPAVYFASQYFAQAQIKVVPKRAILKLAETFQALALPVEGEAPAESKIGYQTMTVQASEETPVAVSEKKSVSERASGKILIVNRYSSRPQKLIATTRFQDVTGRIYRLPKEVNVPGYVLVNGKMTDGEIETAVEADKPGAEFNGEVKELTIPAFKSDARFEKITARGLAPFTGGFVGERAVIAPADRTKAEQELTERLRSILLDEATASVPDGFLTFPAGQFFKFQSRTETKTPETLTVTLDGELTALIFSRRKLSQYLAASALTDYGGEEVEITDFDNLKFEISQTDTFDPLTAKAVEIKVNGSAELVWQFDRSALQKALAGVSQEDYQTVFLKFPSIVHIETVIQPPWLRRFPSETARIEILVD
ncbi:MAG: hypothetical protein AAB677_01115 [Patescibacteria group bacterium]